MGLKTKIGLIFEEEQTVEGEKRRGEEEEEEEEDEEEEGEAKIKGMELTLGMNSSMDHMDFVWNSRKVYEFQT